MKTVLIAAMVAGLVNMAAAGLPDIDIAPTGSGGEINGGRVVLSWGFGAGAPLVTPANIGASERAEGIGGGGAVEQPSAVVTHLKNNWGKWLIGLATAGGYVLLADNNDYWPFSGDDDNDPVDAPSLTATTTTGASSGQGGAAINGDDNIIVNGGTVTIYQDSPIANEK